MLGKVLVWFKLLLIVLFILVIVSIYGMVFGCVFGLVLVVGLLVLKLLECEIFRDVCVGIVFVCFVLMVVLLFD